jgi:ABC-2 type transport system permease protein
MSTSAKVARDTWLIFQRQSLVAFRTPVAFGLSLFQPVMYVLLWAPVLKEALRNTGVTSYSDAFRTYVPGLVTVMAVYGGLFAGFGLLAEIRSGIIERGRVTPVSRASLMLGRALSDVATMFTGALLITLFAVALGMRVGPGDLLFALLIVLLLELMMVSLGYAVSMSVRHEAVLMSVIDTAIQPVVLLAGVLLPLTVAPLLMVRIAKWDPFYWITTGVRALYNENPGSFAVWVSLAVTVAMTAVAMSWSVHLFARKLQ